MVYIFEAEEQMKSKILVVKLLVRQVSCNPGIADTDMWERLDEGFRKYSDEDLKEGEVFESYADEIA